MGALTAEQWDINEAMPFFDAGKKIVVKVGFEVEDVLLIELLNDRYGAHNVILVDQASHFYLDTKYTNPEAIEHNHAAVTALFPNNQVVRTTRKGLTGVRANENINSGNALLPLVKLFGYDDVRTALQHWAYDDPENAPIAAAIVNTYPNYHAEKFLRYCHVNHHDPYYWMRQNPEAEFTLLYNSDELVKIRLDAYVHHYAKVVEAQLPNYEYHSMSNQFVFFPWKDLKMPEIVKLAYKLGKQHCVTNSWYCDRKQEAGTLRCGVCGNCGAFKTLLKEAGKSRAIKFEK